MPAAAASEPRTSISTTVVLALASVPMAMVAIFGETDSFTPTTVVSALIGLVPWALVAGGVELPIELFAVLAFAPAAVMILADDNAGGMFPLFLLVVWVTLRARRRWLEVAVLAASGALIAVLNTIDKPDHDGDDRYLIYFWGGLGISWMTGMMLRRQEALTRQVRAMRDNEVQRLAADERARIAREVHDVVAHSLTVVMLNLTGARRALATSPERADEALARAEVVGRDSLDSIRQVMGLLHDPAQGASLPHPSIDGIPQLVAGFRTAGLVVELAMHDPGPADPTVELVVYRLVQESLSNVLQHAPGASATVTLRRDGEQLDVVVANGPPTSPPVDDDPARPGLGTRGMAERVRSVGGTFDARSTAGGGWTVAARVPVPFLTMAEPATPDDAPIEPSPHRG